MASLTHVCVWSKNGWKRITPEEVAREHSRGGVSARSGIFMCSLCGQYVTFFNGRVQAPHFRHSSAEADKSCRNVCMSTDTTIHMRQASMNFQFGSQCYRLWV